MKYANSLISDRAAQLETSVHPTGIEAGADQTSKNTKVVLDVVVFRAVRERITNELEGDQVNSDGEFVGTFGDRECETG